MRVVDADNEEHEAERSGGAHPVLRAGTDASGSGHRELQDFAISLPRQPPSARDFEIAMRKAQIPYKVSGGQSFFDRAEIRDLCAWLRLWVNNDDDPAFLRAVTTPKRGIGHQTLASLGQFASQYKISMFEALFSSSLPSVLNARALGSLHEFGRYVNDLEFRARLTTGAEDARAFLTDWLKDIGYEKHLYDAEESEKAAASKVDQCDGVLRLDGPALWRPN